MYPEILQKMNWVKFLYDTVNDFSVDHCLVEKEDILNIHEYLMVKNDIK